MSKAAPGKPKTRPSDSNAVAADVTNVPASTPSQPQLAVQMYTLRSLKLPPDEIFAAVAAIGYRGVELAGVYGLTAPQLRAALDRQGLRAVSAHVGLADLERDLPGVVRYHKALGNDVLVVPWVPEALRGADSASWRQLGARLAGLARRCAMANVSLMYHNHDFEMVVIEGRPAIDWLMEAAHQTEEVGFEIDLAWVKAGGQDPAAMLRNYTGRASRVHAKDWSEQQGIADVSAGSLDWDEVLETAQTTGVEWLIVEHDHPTEPLTSIQNSYAFLANKLRQEVAD